MENFHILNKPLKQSIKLTVFHALKFLQTYHIVVSLPQNFCAVNLPLYGKFERENKLTTPWKLYTPDDYDYCIYKHDKDMIIF